MLGRDRQDFDDAALTYAAMSAATTKDGWNRVEAWLAILALFTHAALAVSKACLRPSLRAA